MVVGGCPCSVGEVSTTRRRRANGEASREKVLDAAAEIAGERGYEGTSINLISDRSGLPPSSIYWHFTDKDHLIAEVIDRSYLRWREATASDVDVDAAEPDRSDESFAAAMRRTGAAISSFPDFLRLGLLLVLERRPEEPTARRKFVDIRSATAAETTTGYTQQFPDLDTDDVQRLTMVTMALADGLFVAHEAGECDLGEAFDLLATAVLGTADRLRAARQTAAAADTTAERASSRRRAGAR